METNRDIRLSSIVLGSTEPRASGHGQRMAAIKRGYAAENGWQATKSELTRQEALDATIRCFVKLGYARTTTREIATEASMSRGAVVHHFASKQDLLRAVVSHLEQRRIAEFRALVSSIPSGVDHTDAGIEVYWKHLTSPLFVAYHELVVATRTDEELADLFWPTIRQFEAEWYTEVQRLFPEWRGTGERFNTAMDVTQFLMEGMAIHSWVHRDSDRYEKVRGYLKARLKELLGQ
jgi:AcrR family transcriptional regulator